MEKTEAAQGNIQSAVPFFMVRDMEVSLRFYKEGLGFNLIHKWIPKEKIEWCSLRRDGADLMLQEIRRSAIHSPEPGRMGAGVAICFVCKDALQLYHEFVSKGLEVHEPFVGNGMWVTGLSDPDGYRLEFESYTDVPEETKYRDWKSRS